MTWFRPPRGAPPIAPPPGLLSKDVVTLGGVGGAAAAPAARGLEFDRERRERRQSTMGAPPRGKRCPSILVPTSQASTPGYR